MQIKWIFGERYSTFFQMRYYPINLDVAGRPVVVIGGGKVAWRKVRPLLAAGASVTVVAPDLVRGLLALRRKRKVCCKQRCYRDGDLKGAFLAVAATSDPEVHRGIRAEATRGGILLNVVDCPKICDFTLPSRVARGDFLLTISTGGQAPALSKRVRKRLERQFGPEYGRLVKVMSKKGGRS